MDLYDFSDAATCVYSWWQYQFCDVFIEAIKPYFASDNARFSSERASARNVLWLCLENCLCLLHPLMPFVTKELWQHLPGAGDFSGKASIMICDYLSPIESWTNNSVEYEMDLVESTVKMHTVTQRRVCYLSRKMKGYRIAIDYPAVPFRWRHFSEAASSLPSCLFLSEI